MSEQIGLRERKKLATRQRIQAVAVELFGSRGFDRVTVTEVAQAADVSQATVFNYFPTKEDLILDGMAAYGQQLVTTLRDRAPGTSVLEAFRDDLLQPRGALADADPARIESLVRVRRIIADSPALRAREHLISEATANELAELLADGSPERVRPRFLAFAMIGLTQALTLEIYRLATEGRTGSQIAAIVLPQSAEAVEVLIRGTGSGSAPDAGDRPTVGTHEEERR